MNEIYTANRVCERLHEMWLVCRAADVAQCRAILMKQIDN